jgi:hypothetical protein
MTSTFGDWIALASTFNYKSQSPFLHVGTPLATLSSIPNLRQVIWVKGRYVSPSKGVSLPQKALTIINNAIRHVKGGTSQAGVLVWITLWLAPLLVGGIPTQLPLDCLFLCGGSLQVENVEKRWAMWGLPLKENDKMEIGGYLFIDPHAMNLSPLNINGNLNSNDSNRKLPVVATVHFYFRKVHESDALLTIVYGTSNGINSFDLWNASNSHSPHVSTLQQHLVPFPDIIYAWSSKGPNLVSYGLSVCSPHLHNVLCDVTSSKQRFTTGLLMMAGALQHETPNVVSQHDCSEFKLSPADQSWKTNYFAASHTFESNLAHFCEQNVLECEDRSHIALMVSKRSTSCTCDIPCQFSASEIRSQSLLLPPNCSFLDRQCHFAAAEVIQITGKLESAGGSGIVSAFFLYRDDNPGNAEEVDIVELIRGGQVAQGNLYSAGAKQSPFPFPFTYNLQKELSIPAHDFMLEWIGLLHASCAEQTVCLRILIWWANGRPSVIAMDPQCAIACKAAKESNATCAKIPQHPTRIMLSCWPASSESWAGKLNSNLVPNLVTHEEPMYSAKIYEIAVARVQLSWPSIAN